MYIFLWKRNYNVQCWFWSYFPRSYRVVQLDHGPRRHGADGVPDEGLFLETPPSLTDQWPFSQKFLQFLVRFSVKNFVREILRAFHKRIRSLFNLKISLTRNSSLATVSNGLILRWKLSQLKMNPGFHSQKTYYIPQFNNIEWNQCDARVLETDVTITTCVQK